MHVIAILIDAACLWSKQIVWIGGRRCRSIKLPAAGPGGWPQQPPLLPPCGKWQLAGGPLCRLCLLQFVKAGCAATILCISVWYRVQPASFSHNKGRRRRCARISSCDTPRAPASSGLSSYAGGGNTRHRLASSRSVRWAAPAAHRARPTNRACRIRMCNACCAAGGAGDTAVDSGVDARAAAKLKAARTSLAKHQSCTNSTIRHRPSPGAPPRKMPRSVRLAGKPAESQRSTRRRASVQPPFDRALACCRPAGQPPSAWAWCSCCSLRGPAPATAAPPHPSNTTRTASSKSTHTTPMASRKVRPIGPVLVLQAGAVSCRHGGAPAAAAAQQVSLRPCRLPV
jgi:hypothetical protein